MIHLPPQPTYPPALPLDGAVQISNRASEAALIDATWFGIIVSVLLATLALVVLLYERREREEDDRINAIADGASGSIVES